MKYETKFKALKLKCCAVEESWVEFELHESALAPDDNIFYVLGTPCRIDTVVQFIGLFDESKHEVYHHDLVKIDNNILEVMHDDAEAQFCLVPIGRTNIKFPASAVSSGSVIGNRYSTPEILGEK